MPRRVEACTAGQREQCQAAGARTSRRAKGPQDTFSEASGVVMVSAQRRLRVLQPDAGSGCQHARLPHPPAQQLPRTPGLSDKLPASSQHRAGRGAQALHSHQKGDPSCPGGLPLSPLGMCPGMPQPESWALSPMPPLCWAHLAPGTPSPREHTLEKHRDTESQCWVICAGSTSWATAAFISRAPSMCTRSP